MEGPGLTGNAGALMAGTVAGAGAKMFEQYAGGSSVPLATFTGDTHVSPSYFNEVVLNYLQRGVNQYIHYVTPMARACIAKIKSQLRLVVPEFWLSNKLMEQDDKYRLGVQKAWMDFGMDYADEWHLSGVVAYRLNDTPMGDPVPQIVTSNYIFITRYVNLHNDTPGFRAWKTIKRSNGVSLVNPIVDRKVSVLFGYDADPDATGRLLTPLSPLIKEEMFMKLLRDCAMQAEVILSKPEKVVQLPDTLGAKIPEGLSHGYYINGDTEQKREADRVERSTAEIWMAIQQSQRIRKHWDEVTKRELALNAGKSPHNRQGLSTQQANLTPLTPGATLASQVLPSPRADLLGFIENNNEMVCTLYGIPKAVLVGESNKTAAGATTNVGQYNETMRMWCARLGDVFTRLYQRIYGVADTIFQLETNDDGDVRLRVMEVVLPFMPSKTQEELLTDYIMGFITWDECRLMRRGMLGMHTPKSSKRSKEGQDPWDQATKLSMLQGLQSGALSMTGLAGSFIFNAMPVNTMIQGTEMLVDQSVNPPKTEEGGAGAKRKAGGSSGSNKKKTKA